MKFEIIIKKNTYFLRLIDEMFDGGHRDFRIYEATSAEPFTKWQGFKLPLNAEQFAALVARL